MFPSVLVDVRDLILGRRVPRAQTISSFIRDRVTGQEKTRAQDHGDAINVSAAWISMKPFPYHQGIAFLSNVSQGTEVPHVVLCGSLHALELMA